MLKSLLLVALLSFTGAVKGQIAPLKHNRKQVMADSTKPDPRGGDLPDDIPVVLMNEAERNDNSGQYIAPLLTANRDAFYNAASFHFSALHFRIRGYDGSFFSTCINGLPMNTLDDGNTPWTQWGGLADVMRNTLPVQGLRNNDFSFGTPGMSVAIDTRASRQRKHTQFGYGFSNRSYAHRWTLTHGTGMKKKGWAFAFSGSRRAAEEGQVPGTFYNGWSYFIAVDKKLDERQLLSLSLFGAPLISGRQGPVLQESVVLAGDGYNPYWGYQAGKKRNAHVGSNNQPLLLLTHELRMSNHTTLLTSAGFSTGEKSSTGLDWYKAHDPRPDYYRYLPGYQKDTLLQAALAAAIRNDVQLQQINWQKMYDINRNSMETLNDAYGISGNTIRGLRSHYIVEDRVTRIQRFHGSSTFNTLLMKQVTVTTGINFQKQQNRYFKRVNDLLGGEYYVNWNQFAERTFPNNRDAVQNDLDHPDRVLRKGDRFGYDYSMHFTYSGAWLQVAVTRNKTDLFAAVAFSHTQYTREGHVRNGLFRGNSLGKSVTVNFTNQAFKAGLTYKINGRNYLYFHGAFLTKAPLSDNVFISPRTRDTQQEQAAGEKIKTAEAGYILNAPSLKLRLSGYLTQFKDGMNVLTFYHDAYQNFVNYALSNIDKLHFGGELGLEAKLTAHWSLNAVLAMGRYYYTSRQQVTVSQDNDAFILEKSQIYSQYFRVAGTPQEAGSIECRYQSNGNFFFNITGNWFNQQWLDFNPMRRTYEALQGVAAGSEQWNRIIHQTRLPAKITVDLFAGMSWHLRTPRGVTPRTLVFNISINNVLNDRNLVSGGYEQLRFDMDTRNVDKFPPKFFYAYGLNFSANLLFRL
ncbi:MAG: TonB-dependent receptor [Sediminibacterium sp.]